LTTERTEIAEKNKYCSTKDSVISVPLWLEKMLRMLETNEITETIIGAAIRVHKELGPGLLESAYQECLFFELQQADVQVEKEKPLPLIYRNVKMDCGYRIDLLVEEEVVVEIKAVKAIEDIHIAQTLAYMKLTNTEIGLIINFNVTQLTKGVKRLINKYYEE